ncbi:MAG: hypothetical protein RBS13_06265 [Bacteroidales bacterium]|jgi:hypothetical protein|nr:hypothetical protein [Bacteroidales bacterium]
MKKLIVLLLTVLCISGCSADPEAKTAKEWVKEALIEDYVGDDEVVFLFEDDYEIYVGGDNLGNYVEWEGEYLAIFSIEVIQFDGEIIKKYYAFIQWEEHGNSLNLFTKPENRKISDEFLLDLDFIER